METTEYREYLSTQEQHRRGHRTGNSIHLRPEANSATQVGLNLLVCRATGRKSRVNAEKMAALDPDSTLGRLVTAAIAWADTEPIGEDMTTLGVTAASYQMTRWRLALAMRDMQDEIDPEPERTPLTTQSVDDTCLHGVSFRDVCPDCEP